MVYNYESIEEKWLRRWSEERAFEPKPNGKKFLLTVPWPYCNGALHIGHGRTYTVGDIVARYKRMKGFNVLYPMGFHISGTPILAFSKKIENGDAQTINLYKSYLELYGDDPSKVSEFAVPANIASYFSERIINDFTNMGFSIDWTRKFTSGEPIYNKFVEWQFRMLQEKNLIKRGDYPILYSEKEGNPVGEDDILEGDTDKVSITQFTGVFFYIGNDILLASTVRPETLDGVTNIFMNPEVQYCRIRMRGQSFIVSKRAFDKLKFQRDAEFVSDVNVDDYIHKMAREPLYSREIPIFPGRFVDPEIGTGVDYSVPAHSVWDHVGLMEISERPNYIQVIETEKQNVTMEEIRKKFGISNLADREKLIEATKYVYEQEYYHGKIVRGKFKGNIVKDVKDRITDDLIQTGIAIPIYETSRKAETREGNPVIVAVIKNQWFIDYSLEEWKDKVRKLVGTMDLRPDNLKNQFLQTVDWIKERPCARKRGLGTRLPMDSDWIIESLSDSTIYTVVYTIMPFLRKMKLDEIDDELFNYVFFGSGILDHKSEQTVKEAEEARKEYLYWYPVDLRHTSYPHISNHLTFYLFNHVAIFPRNEWPVGISTGGMVISEGQKMSKSKGNVYPLLTVKRKYGADLFRMYLASNADVWYDVDWRTSEVENYSKKLEKFYTLLEEARDVKDEADDRDLWIVSRMADRITKSSKSYDSMRIREATIDLFFNALNDARDLENFSGKERALRAIRKFAKEWALSLSPVIPFIAEEVYSMYGGSGFASLQPYPTMENPYKRQELEWDFVESIVGDFRSITKVSNMRPNRMVIGVAEEWKWKLLEESKTRDIKAMIRDASPEQREYLLMLMKKKDLNQIVRDEEAVLVKFKDDLARYLNIDIAVTNDAAYSKKALPGRPAIRLE
ncbi:MAG: leucine--tRNA ligase [Thermoplasmatales archaeon]|nr:leucine--tRNA ligase [Candidatus Thermoplasmatota archaeon]MCL6003498.1 leucine--tRNA ligase [Candidatus Thermoplasmatota archaeon]MDA8054427.1 leucine--tRNA ligase [Thermoplasmatales archaeon]